MLYLRISSKGLLGLFTEIIERYKEKGCKVTGRIYYNERYVVIDLRGMLKDV